MKKVISLVLAIMLCLGVTTMALASESVFVPSIGYKDGPEIEGSEMNGEDMGACLVITSIQQAKEKTTDIYQEARDELLDVYEQLNSGAMKLPLEKDYVIRELVDVSFRKTSCVEAAHGHKEWLAMDDTTITIDFDLGVAKDANVVVMSYYEGAWENIVSVTNNGDGSVTCVFEHFCPVAFCVEAEETSGPAQTGDVLGQDLILWVILMALSLAGILALLVMRKKLVREYR